MTVATNKNGPLLFMPEMARSIFRLDNPKRVTRRLKFKFETGDRIWGKEAYRAPTAFDGVKPSEIPARTPIRYEADGQILGAKDTKFGKLRPSLFMCQWMSRIHLELVDVRQELLHDITEEEALLEGIETVRREGGTYYRVGELQALTPVLLYSMLWDKANGAGSWDKNPLVYRIEFNRIPF